MLNGILLAFAAYAAFAFSDACVKFLDGGLSPYEIAFFGAVFGLAALPFMKRGDEHWRDIFITRNKPMWLLRTIMATSGVIGSVVAFTYLSMAEAFALIFLLPAFVTILSVLFLKEQVGWKRWSAVLIGFIGVMIVLRPGFRELSLGHLGALFAGFSGAVGIVILRVMGKHEKRITLYSSGLFGPIIICGLLTVSNYASPSAEQWLYLAGYGLLAALANILLMVAAQRAPASAIASPQYSQMIWAILFGYLVFHDTVDLPMLTGIVLIIISGFFTFVREEKRGVAKPLSVATSEPGPVLVPEEAQPAPADETSGKSM
ncbi:transporter [Paramesorhizobium deserti]|uniref:Transporter n=1 Tax=Paramesorhizobium deserti TaxID=1494590 RepID=A0A135HQ85_9HYPH|nr:DMT family transporter [Paramesorhizobium deserti]KXF75357.1 transporter [Paramesorhizobium deserti]